MEETFRRREFSELLHRLDVRDSRGVVVVGDSGVGKTVLLHQLKAELERLGRAACFVSLRGSDEYELSGGIFSALRSVAGAFDVEGVIRESGGASLRQTAAVLDQVAGRLRAPVLLLDGLDESRYPQRVAAAIEEMSRTVLGWRFVVASRSAPGIELRRFAQRLDVLALAPLPDAELAALVRDSAPGLSEDDLREVVRAAQGSPLFARIIASASPLARMLAFPQSGTSETEVGQRLGDLVESAVGDALKTSEARDLVGLVLEELTLAGGRDRMTSLARRVRITDDQLIEVLRPLSSLLRVDLHAGTVAFGHALVQQAVLSQRVFDRPFRLAELRFGAEEAERDDLLDASFVGRHSLGRILDQKRSIVVGDRGSGKSALFRKLAQDPLVLTLPVTDTADLLHRIVDKDAWLDADALRAAWLVVVAAYVVSAVPDEAPRATRRSARDLRGALGLSMEPLSRGQRMLRAVAGLLGGTTLKFGVGPVNFEATLPAGARPGGSFLDVETLLREMDELLSESGRRVVVLLDRIDETFKYDRGRQETMVQALLQAEARISHLRSIELVVFLRTDLFELYDIQEKNKLISRSLTLDWSEEDWLQVLIRRVFANEPFGRLARRLHVADEDIELRAALEVLFPAEIEGQSIDRWLIESLRNGNGDISPRLAVLLLHLTRDRSAGREDVVTAIPLFSADAVRRAMTKLSDLSFSEVVNDFKIAPTFVLNCRAGKLTSFTLPEVEQLFEEAEGKVADQVRLLERLGFLERVVEQQGTRTRSTFRIPRLYTRCWDHA